MRELRVGSVISAGLSIFLMAVSGVSLAGGSSSPKETNLWIVAIVAGFVLAATSVLYTATEEKKVGLLHGVLMAIAAIAIFYVGICCLPDRRHWRGGFVEMIQVPVAGGMILFSVAAAGSALQTFLRVSEKKPNQSPQTTRASGPRV